MPYVQLAAAIVLELCGTTFLKMSEGFTKLGPSVLCMVLYFFCFFIFSKALVHLNLGVAYATWSGVGLVVTAIISAVLFGQRLSLVGMIAIALIVVGCVLLNLFGTAQ